MEMQNERRNDNNSALKRTESESSVQSSRKGEKSNLDSSSASTLTSGRTSSACTLLSVTSCRQSNTSATTNHALSTSSPRMEVDSPSRMLNRVNSSSNANNTSPQFNTMSDDQDGEYHQTASNQAATSMGTVDSLSHASHSMVSTVSSSARCHLYNENTSLAAAHYQQMNSQLTSPDALRKSGSQSLKTVTSLPKMDAKAAANSNIRGDREAAEVDVSVEKKSAGPYGDQDSDDGDGDLSCGSANSTLGRAPSPISNQRQTYVMPRFCTNQQVSNSVGGGGAADNLAQTAVFGADNKIMRPEAGDSCLGPVMSTQCSSSSATSASSPINGNRSPSEDDDDTPQVELGSKELLGAGSFGNVYKAIDVNTNCIIAVKEVLLFDASLNAIEGSNGMQGQAARRAHDNRVRTLQREITVMQRLHHPNIVTYLGCHRSDNALNIYMEYVAGGTITSLLKTFGPMKPMVAARFTRHILLGLAYLHRQNIIHRDLKGDNLFVGVDGTLKVGDFGTAKELNLDASQYMANSVAGTPYFMSPEVVKNKGHGVPTDIWSLGCCVIQMLSGKPPFFKFDNPFTVMYQVTKGSDALIASVEDDLRACMTRHDDDNSVKENALAFIKACCVSDPEQRPTCEELLLHPWIAAANSQQRKRSNSQMRHANSKEDMQKIVSSFSSKPTSFTSKPSSPLPPMSPTAVDVNGTKTELQQQTAAAMAVQALNSAAVPPVLSEQCGSPLAIQHSNSIKNILSPSSEVSTTRITVSDLNRASNSHVPPALQHTSFSPEQYQSPPKQLMRIIPTAQMLPNQSLPRAESATFVSGCVSSVTTSPSNRAPVLSLGDGTSPMGPAFTVSSKHHTADDGSSSQSLTALSGSSSRRASPGGSIPPSHEGSTSTADVSSARRVRGTETTLSSSPASGGLTSELTLSVSQPSESNTESSDRRPSAVSVAPSGLFNVSSASMIPHHQQILGGRVATAAMAAATDILSDHLAEDASADFRRASLISVPSNFYAKDVLLQGIRRRSSIEPSTTEKQHSDSNSTSHSNTNTNTVSHSTTAESDGMSSLYRLARTADGDVTAEDGGLEGFRFPVDSSADDKTRSESNAPEASAEEASIAPPPACTAFAAPCKPSDSTSLPCKPSRFACDTIETSRELD